MRMHPRARDARRAVQTLCVSCVGSNRVSGGVHGCVGPGAEGVIVRRRFVEFTEVEARQLEAACSAGGASEGLVLFTGAEGRSHSAWGEHITFVANHPELLIATHPNTIMADGQEQVHSSRFVDDSSFQNVNFLEVFNGW